MAGSLLILCFFVFVTAVRADHRGSGTVLVWQADRELSGTRVVGGFQRGLDSGRSKGATARSVSGCDGNDTQRTAGAADDFQWRGNDDGTGRRKLIKVAESGKAILAAAVHEVVVREGRVKGGGLTSVGPDRLHADAQHISLLRKKRRALFGQPRGVWPILF